jgi:hypothetical protein
MTDHRLPYTDAETLPEMAVDCHEVEHNMHLRHRGVESHPTEYLGEGPPPASTRVHSRFEVSDDLARMADGLELHFD